MTYQEIYDYIKNNNGERFIVTFVNGSVETKRLFISTDDNICEFYPRSRRRGRVISVNNFDSIRLKIVNKKSGVELCRANLDKVIKYLTESGFWTPMLRGAIYLSKLTDEELSSMCNWDNYHKVMNEDLTKQGIQWFGCDCFINMFNVKIKTMNFDKYERTRIKSLIKESITNKRNFSYRWRNGYDNSFEIRFGEPYNCAWYSEEYKDCGNGHYYFLLDETHVIFGEDD